MLRDRSCRGAARPAADVGRARWARWSRPTAGTYPGAVPAGLSPMHLLVILVVALVVLGPDKLPDAARQVAKSLAQARELSAGLSAQVENAMSVDDHPPSATTVAMPEGGAEAAGQYQSTATVGAQESVPPNPEVSPAEREHL